MNLGPYSKQLSIAGLMALWLAMDILKIDDQNLKIAIMGLISSITGWHVLNNLPGAAKNPSQAQPQTQPQPAQQ
jgi:hypothetical protein